MKTPKFLDIIASGSTITVNTQNIASYETSGGKIKIILNVKDNDGKFITHESLVPMTETMNLLFKQD